MGWDVKATADGVAQVLPPDLTISQAAGWLSAILLVLGVALVLGRLVPRIWAAIEETVLTNWRLAILGTAALLLSLAGGWTTWDGMRNFTGESVLSAFFTFGIHGVMLIVAWLIGESFATGMNQMVGTKGRRVSPPAVALSVVGGALVIVAAAVAVVRIGVSENQVLYGTLAAGAALLGASTLIMFSRSDMVWPYAQGIRIIVKNGMLWVMFLACMSTSVFFSFDSRFNVIFPSDQRARAAEIRAKRQVAGVVADIGETIETRRLSEAQRVFESDGWGAYDEQLQRLSTASQGAEALIEAHFTRLMEAHRSSIAEQQQRIATAESGQAGLNVKKTTLTDELSRIRAERPGLAAELAEKKTELDNRAMEVDAKRVEAMAESKGVEGSLKQGKGPIWRERMAELRRLRDYYKIGEERVRDAKRRLETVDTRIAKIERELAGVDGDLAQLQGEVVTAEQRISAAKSSQIGQESGPKVDPARVRAAFERARVEFRQEPTTEALAALHRHCVNLFDAMVSTKATKERVRNVDCDPKQATEASALLFALNTGRSAFSNRCSGGDKVPVVGGVDGLLQFGRKCLQDSGLPSRDVGELASNLQAIDLNRDDKAHNFVVTLNAFDDGNRLAYLALAIAIGIDSLIFMAGLFGANAVRSPLSDVPSLKARNSQQLNAMIEAALLPDTFRKARLVAQALHPIHNADGFSNEVRLSSLDPETAVQVRDVLNAGAVIGAVRKAGDEDGHYLVRSELLEFLNMIIKRELEVNADAARHGLRLDQLEEQLRVALMPHVGATADTALRTLVPMDEYRGFTAEVDLREVPDASRHALAAVLNTGATFELVQRASQEQYYVHKDLYTTLSRIRAREVVRHGGLPDQPQLDAPPAAVALQASDDKRLVEALDRPARMSEHTLPAPQASNGVSDVLRDEVRRQYLDTLVAAMGIDPAALANLSDQTFTAALQASEAFHHARQANPILNEELQDREDEAHRTLEAVYGRLYAAAGTHEEWRRLLLEDVSQEIDGMWQVLMLLPNGPIEGVMQRIVEDLEPDNGAGTLSGDDRALLEAARQLAKAFRENDRQSDGHWMQLESAFHQAVRAQQLAGVEDTKRTLN